MLFQPSVVLLCSCVYISVWAVFDGWCFSMFLKCYSHSPPCAFVAHLSVYVNLVFHIFIVCEHTVRGIMLSVLLVMYSRLHPCAFVWYFKKFVQLKLCYFTISNRAIRNIVIGLYGTLIFGFIKGSFNFVLVLRSYPVCASVLLNGYRIILQIFYRFMHFNFGCFLFQINAVLLNFLLIKKILKNSQYWNSQNVQCW